MNFSGQASIEKEIQKKIYSVQEIKEY